MVHGDAIKPDQEVLNPCKSSTLKLIATVNQLEKVALWHWPRELLIREWILEMTCREEHNIVIFSQQNSKVILAHTVAVGDVTVTTWSRGVNTRLDGCLCLCVAPLIN